MSKANQQKVVVDPLSLIKPIFDEKNSKLWWQYRQYNEKEMEDIRNFFNQNSQVINQNMTNNIFDNFKLCSSLIGVHPHPALKEVPQYFINQKEINDNQDENQPIINSNQDQQSLKEINFLILNNYQIDFLTSFILSFIWPHSTISLLKFSYNLFDDYTLQFLTNFIINPANKINKLFFEWNKLSEKQQMISIPLFGKSETIEMLILRSNNLTDNCVQQLVNNLVENQNVQLKFFDLYDNNLSQNSLNHLGVLLEKNRTLESLGLSKNNFNHFNQLKPILDNIGKFQMSEEQLESYRQKEKDKEAIIQRNSKLKPKQVPEVVPVLDPIVQNADQTFSILKNMKMQLINLSVNNIDDESKDSIEKFMLQANEKFSLILTNNKFTDKFKEKFKKKLNKKIHL